MLSSNSNKSIQIFSFKYVVKENQKDVFLGVAEAALGIYARENVAGCHAKLCY